MQFDIITYFMDRSYWPRNCKCYMPMVSWIRCVHITIPWRMKRSGNSLSFGTVCNIMKITILEMKRNIYVYM